MTKYSQDSKSKIYEGINVQKFVLKSPNYSTQDNVKAFKFRSSIKSPVKRPNKQTLQEMIWNRLGRAVEMRESRMNIINSIFRNKNLYFVHE